jgi:catechol 2,3-dioxygenase
MERPDPGKIHPNTKIGAVRLAVKSLSRMNRFYTEELGLTLIGEEDGTAHLGVGENVLLKLISRPNGEPDTGSAGMFHMAFLLPSRQDLADWLNHYMERGNYLTGVGDHLVSEALYLSDPERNGIEVYRDRPQEEWMYDQGRLKMDTLPIDLNNLLSASPNNRTKGMSEETLIGHIHLRTSDIETSTNFYREVLGFGLQTTFPRASFLSAGNYHHHIGINQWGRYEPRSPKENQLGLVDYEIVFPDENEREKILGRLPDGDSANVGNKDDIQIIDPVGIKIVLTVSK